MTARTDEIADAVLPLPADIEIEQSLLGVLLLNERAYPLVASVLKAEDFSLPVHARLTKILLTASPAMGV